MNQVADIAHLFLSCWNPADFSLSSIIQRSEFRDVVCGSLALLLLIAFAFLSTRPRYIKGIPVVPSSWFLGVADRLLPITDRVDSHEFVRDIDAQHGPVTQFYLFGDLVVLVTDPVLSKVVLERVKGKTPSQVSRGTNSCFDSIALN